MIVEIPNAGAETVYWTVAAAHPLDNTVNVWVAFLYEGFAPTGTTTWHVSAWTDSIPASSRNLSVLVAGPSCSPLPLGAVQLPTGEYIAWVKLDRSPEIVIRASDDPLIVK